LANDNLSNNGVILGGKDFEISKEKALELGLENRPSGKKHIRRYIGGSALTSRFEEGYVLDLFGLSEQEFQEVFQRLFNGFTRESGLSDLRTNGRLEGIIGGCLMNAFRNFVRCLPGYLDSLAQLKLPSIECSHLLMGLFFRITWLFPSPAMMPSTSAFFHPGFMLFGHWLKAAHWKIARATTNPSA